MDNQNDESVEGDENDQSEIYEDNEQITLNFRNKLKNWSLEYNITQLQLKRLLEVCNESLPFKLSIDPRTIRNTPRIVDIQTIGINESYWHNGLQAALASYLPTVNTSCLENRLQLDINIDGLPLFRSSKNQFNPILCRVFGLKDSKCLWCLFWKK